MNYVIYGTTIFIAIAIKYIYEYLSMDYLLFVLKPVTSLVEVTVGGSFIYDTNIGYISEKLSIVIGRECAGINFFIIMFLMLTISFAIKFKGRKDKLLLMVYFFVVSYIMTIIANASRIITSILVLRIGIVGDAKQAILLHQSVGIIFYFLYLVGTYYIFLNLTKRMEGQHEKFI